MNAEEVLRERRLDARDLADLGVHLGQQLRFCHALAPFRLGLHVHQQLGHVDELRIGAVLRPPGLGGHAHHLGRPADRLPDAAIELLRLGDRYARGQEYIHPDGAFVQLRQELGSQARHQRERSRERDHRGDEHRAWPLERPAKRWRIKPLRAAHQRVLLLWQIALEHHRAEQRYQRQRQDQRADQRGDDRVGHRREDATLVALQREDRDVRRDDDEHGKERRPAHLDGGLQDDILSRPVVELMVRVPLLGQASEHVLHHDHCAIDDDAEVHRAE